jgi:hypothetical protein
MPTLAYKSITPGFASEVTVGVASHDESWLCMKIENRKFSPAGVPKPQKKLLMLQAQHIEPAALPAFSPTVQPVTQQ